MINPSVRAHVCTAQCRWHDPHLNHAVLYWTALVWTLMTLVVIFDVIKGAPVWDELVWWLFFDTIFGVVMLIFVFFNRRCEEHHTIAWEESDAPSACTVMVLVEDHESTLAVDTQGPLLSVSSE